MNHVPPPTERPASDRVSDLERLFDDAHDELLGTLYYLVGNIEDARDALQDTFVKCWRNQHQCDRIENLKAWVFRIALNTGRDLRKSAWQRRRTSLPEAPVMQTSIPPPEVHAQQHEQIDRLREAVLTLRPEEQEVFLLRQNGSMTYEQIAQATGLPLGTVKTRMRAAISQLRQSVGEQS